MRTATIAAIALMAAVASLVFPPDRTPESPATAVPPSPPAAPAITADPPAAPHRAVTQPAGPTPPEAPVHPEGAAFGSGQPPEREIDVLMSLLNAYREEFGSFPTGEDNPQILNAMAGGNPGAIWFLPRPHPRIDTAGRLLDSWGSPYVFHPISRDHLEIRSAGPDGELFSDDDLVRPPPRP
jgi:hypothetical protein